MFIFSAAHIYINLGNFHQYSRAIFGWCEYHFPHFIDFLTFKIKSIHLTSLRENRYWQVHHQFAILSLVWEVRNWISTSNSSSSSRSRRRWFHRMKISAMHSNARRHTLRTNTYIHSVSNQYDSREQCCALVLKVIEFSKLDHNRFAFSLLLVFFSYFSFRMFISWMKLVDVCFFFIHAYFTVWPFSDINFNDRYSFNSHWNIVGLNY